MAPLVEQHSLELTLFFLEEGTEAQMLIPGAPALIHIINVFK